MIQDQGDKEEKFDFTDEGEALSYVSLERAGVLAMETARDHPGNYGVYSSVPMVFAVTEQQDGEDYYIVTLSFRPEGNFRGTPGREEFFITKEGLISHRQVHSLPTGAAGRRLPVVPVVAGLVVLLIAVAAVVVFVAIVPGGEAADSQRDVITPTDASVEATQEARRSRRSRATEPARPQATQATAASTASPVEPVGPTSASSTIAARPSNTPTPVFVLVPATTAPIPVPAEVVPTRVIVLSTAVPAAPPAPTPTFPARPPAGPVSVEFLTDDGITLGGQLFDGGGNLAVILSHAAPTDQRSWRSFAEQLSRGQGYMVLTYDFRGYGASSGERMFPDLNRDVLAAVNFMRSRGMNRIVLVGASVGGTASLRVAGVEAVSGVVSLSSVVEFRGLTVGNKLIEEPVLMIAEAGDEYAAFSFQQIIDSGVVRPPQLTPVLFPRGDSHGTDIFSGPNGAEATRLILEFLATLP